MFCIKCGAQLPDEAKFCFKCGSPVAEVKLGGQESNTASNVVTEDAKTLCERGNYYFGKENYEQAVYFYKLAADQGYAAAQFSMGVSYNLGYGVEQSYKKALYYYELAADQGYSNAQLNLGNMYANGNGVEKSYGRAVRYYRLAADQGNSVAQKNLDILLGMMAANNKSTPAKPSQTVSNSSERSAEAEQQRDTLKMPRSYVTIGNYDYVSEGDIVLKNHLIRSCYLIGEYLYFYNKEGSICRFNINTNRSEMLGNIKGGYSSLDAGYYFPKFSIFNDRIYYVTDEYVMSMNLDGSDKGVVNDIPKQGNSSFRYEGVWALKDGFLLHRPGGIWRKIDGLDSSLEKLVDLGTYSLIDFTDDEVVIKGKSGISVMSIRTKEKCNITKVYPALKGHEFLMVDSMNGIAYYLDRPFEKGKREELKIVGTDKNGNVVYEKMVMLEVRDGSDDKVSFVFNGMSNSTKIYRYTSDNNSLDINYEDKNKSFSIPTRKGHPSSDHVLVNGGICLLLEFKEGNEYWETLLLDNREVQYNRYS